MSSTEGVTITLSLLDILQHRRIGLCPAGATLYGHRSGWGVGGTNINKNMDAESHSNHRRTAKRSKADDSESDGPCSAPDSHSFSRFIIIMPTDQKTISELSPFWIQKALQANNGTITSLRKTRAGHLFVETNNVRYSQKLLALTDLAGVPVKAEPHRTLNSCEGGHQML